LFENAQKERRRMGVRTEIGRDKDLALSRPILVRSGEKLRLPQTTGDGEDARSEEQERTRFRH
jgi:hypothetical protein